MVHGMPATPVLSRGSQLLAEWRGAATQTQAAELLNLDVASYNRFEHGVRRPSAKVSFKIEQLTDGRVYAKSWYEPPIKKPSDEAKAS